MKLDKSKYINWEKLISNLDKKIEARWEVLKSQLKQDRKNFTNKKELAYV
jgi:hypothetical protein